MRTIQVIWETVFPDQDEKKTDSLAFYKFIVVLVYFWWATWGPYLMEDKN